MPTRRRKACAGMSCSPGGAGDGRAPKSRERALLEGLVAWGRGRAPEPEASQERLL
ncbi:MAG: hypothetical protein Kow0063_24790 [Anaerolineae bacterium]